MDNIFYTYIHIRPDTNEPFYVGKGKGNRYKTKSGRNQHWKNVVNKNNGIFESKILFEKLSEEEALLKEIEIEQELKNKGYNLVNIGKTGEKNGAMGVNRTKEHKQALSKATKGRISPNKGKKHGSFPEESKYWKGKKRPEETKLKQSLSQKDRWEKRGEELKKLYREKNGKSVLQIDAKNFYPLKIFSSIIDAKEATGINGIRNCAAGLQKTAGGYIWIFKHSENPYYEYVINNCEKIRVFEPNDIEAEELWHRDLQDRTITVLEGNGWYFQRDNELPLELEEGVRIFIPKMEWHRVIKGNTILKIKIEE
jgi:hypothetical protein